jgi:hypothetical protein
MPPTPPSGNSIGSFQGSVNSANPIAVEGDFASANPRATALTVGFDANGFQTSGLIAGPNGVTIGQFAWLAADGVTVNNYPSTNGSGKPLGFVHRDQQGLLTNYLQAAGTLIPPGFPVTVMTEGDFFDLIAGGSAAVYGSACYARYSDGALFVGSIPTGGSGTGSIGATFTASAGSPSTQLVVTAVTGLISIGDTVSGTGIPAGTTILSQVSGTAGGAGTYVLSAANTASAATVTSFGNVLDITAVSSGSFLVGDSVTGSNVPSGAVISSQVSGAAGGIGIYTIDIPATQYVASETITIVAGVLTGWVAKTAAAVGALTQISTWGV